MTTVKRPGGSAASSPSTGSGSAGRLSLSLVVDRFLARHEKAHLSSRAPAARFLCRGEADEVPPRPPDLSGCSEEHPAAAKPARRRPVVRRRGTARGLPNRVPAGEVVHGRPQSERIMTPAEPPSRALAPGPVHRSASPAGTRYLNGPSRIRCHVPDRWSTLVVPSRALRRDLPGDALPASALGSGAHGPLSAADRPRRRRLPQIRVGQHGARQPHPPARRSPRPSRHSCPRSDRLVEYANSAAHASLPPRLS